MSMPTILTGENLEVGKSLKDSVNDCIENSQLYDVLQENGYEIEWYVDTALVPNTDASNIIANKKDEKLKVDLKSQMNISSGMMDIVLFKYLPHCLKPLTHVQTEKLNIVSSFSQNPFFVDDFAIYNDVNNGATANLSKKSFKVIEMDGCHYPFNKTEEYERDDSEILDEDMDIRRQAEVTASMKLVWNYINMLKQAGVYDNTTIIVAADHGFDNMYNPTIMIKRKNAHGEKLEVSSAPISMIEDYLPTLLNIVTDSKDYGKDFFDYEEGEGRTRTVYNYYFSAESSQSWVEANIIMGIDGDARNKDDYYIIDEVFDECGSLDKTYKLGKKIDFSLGTNSDMAKSTAILRRPGKEAPKGSIIGHNANINLRVNEVSKDVIANFAISNVYFEEQHVTIQVNGRELFSNVLTTSGNIEFLIPKDVWNEKEIIEILINVPDAKAMFNRESFLKYGNFRSMRSIELKSIQFN